MSFNIEVRKKQLASLNQYVNNSKDKVESILNYLGWTAKRILECPDKINCPINTKHKVSIEKIDNHVKKCCLASAGYTSDDQFLSEPSTSSSSRIVIDQAKKIEILNEARSQNPKFKPAWNGLDPDPMTSDSYFSTYSTDERLALYDYCVKNADALPPPSEFLMNNHDTSNNKEVELTEEERLEKERNDRRRRIKYKAVHAGRNKSYTEVMREVIQNQMEMLVDYIKEKEIAEQEAEKKRQQELKEKAENYEQFPHIDSTVVYDYGIDPFEVIENGYNENSYNGTASFNVNYDYEAEIPMKFKIGETLEEPSKDKEVNNHVEKEKNEKRDKYKSNHSSHSSHRSRDRDRDRYRERRPKSRESKRSERRSRERREHYSRRHRDDRREGYRPDRRY